MKHPVMGSPAKIVKQAKSARHLIWIIPMMTTAVMLVGLVGMGYAAVIQWMRTMALERRALRLCIEEQEQSRRAVPRAEG